MADKEVAARRTRRRETETVTEEAKVSVYRTHLGESKESHEVIQVRKFITEPAYVRVNAGVTRNMGDYESLRIDVSVSVPCYVEEIEHVQREAADLVAQMLDDEQVAYTEGK